MVIMDKALLTRTDTGDEGTFGILLSGSFSCFTTELPWRDNERAYSCIPEGLYEVRWHKSPKFGWCYRVWNVEGRSEILLHSGNYAGDSRLGFRTHSNGCILPSKRRGILDGQKAGLLSVPAVRALNAFFRTETFLLEIKQGQ